MPFLSWAYVFKDSRELEQLPSSLCDNGIGLERSLPKSLVTGPWVPLHLPNPASVLIVRCFPGPVLVMPIGSKCEHSELPSAPKKTAQALLCALSPVSSVIVCESLLTSFQCFSSLWSSEDGAEYCNASLTSAQTEQGQSYIWLLLHVKGRVSSSAGIFTLKFIWSMLPLKTLKIVLLS